MRILHVVPTYLPATRYGGPIYSVHSLCKALAALGHQVQVFTTNVDGPDDSPVPLAESVEMDGVSIWYFPSQYLRRLYWSPSMGRCLRERIEDFDIVHLHSVFLWPTWAAARVARTFGVPYVLSPRGMLVKELIKRKNRLLKSSWIKLSEQRNISRSAFVHLTSEAERKDLDALDLCLTGTVVIPNGVEVPIDWDEDQLSSDILGVIKNQPLVLFLGRINWKKGLDRLINSMSSILDAHLVIAGNDEENYLPRLQNLVSDNKLNSRVTFIPRNIAGDDKEALFAAAKVFVLPSYSENFGNTVPEAMLRGCPVVVTEEVGAADLVLRAQSGRVVSADQLSDAIEAVLNDPLSASRMGEQGRKWVSENLQWKRIAVEMTAEYQRVLNNVSRVG